MESISRSVSPSLANKPPVLFARVASEDQTHRIYLERAPFFRGALSDSEYAQKQHVLDKYSATRCSKTVYALVAANDPDGDVYASLEVHERDIYYRPSIDKAPTLRGAAHLAAIFTPTRHRGHGYARRILHHVSAMPRTAHDDIAVICGSATAGQEAIYGSSVQWHDLKVAEWSVKDSANFFKRGPLLATEPVYAYELSDLLQLAAQRTCAAVAESTEHGPVFAFPPSQSHAQVRLAHYRLDWKLKNPGQEQPAVIGARIGDLNDPASLSFALWGVRHENKDVRIWAFSSRSDQASLSLCRAAIEAAEEIKSDNSVIFTHDGDFLQGIVPLHLTKDSYPDGTLLVDPELDGAPTTCKWLHRVRPIRKNHLISQTSLDLPLWSGA